MWRSVDPHMHPLKHLVLLYTGYSVRTILIEGWMISLDNTEYNADEDLQLHTECHNPCCHARLTGDCPYPYSYVLTSMILSHKLSISDLSKSHANNSIL